MITVDKPGLLTTIQDLGRTGFQKYGVVTSGVMDQFAHRIANLLVGNEENLATMEITLLGPAISFEKDALISLCGADLSAVINDAPVPLWRPIFIKAGSKLCFGPSKYGCRAYLAVAGGIAVPTVMNSKSTYLRASIGGFQGRTLKSSDQLLFQPPGILSTSILKYLKKQQSNQSFQQMNWFVAPNILPPYKNSHRIRVLEGREFSLFTKESQEKLFTDRFSVTSSSDRMGYRLKGITLNLEKQGEIISEAVNFGTIQVPADGNPIILLADRQTTGGYPKIGQIVTVDLPLVAQAKPGDYITFEKITLNEAQLLYLQREQQILLLKHGIVHQFS